ncbi:hypothetical protein Hs30E_16110 [Lactococcus hodotermopsidis]|uniref:HTH araC/xylS-type domain-containing protein n=1 Tax=Pseudolactococcus hodotermopsidis TaxID=2709157 RepID=A0A6A0BCG3_9LACT|nr:AraC family transcriptional regulator [Lactococcus hodotermopsidis]GFH43060.1 hypothetical protein Hs30E_16110 [Lactococcus hodotermopsidis]
MSWSIDVYSDKSENLTYNKPDFPIYARINDLQSYQYAAPCHWHRDLEFIKVLSGSMAFSVNGEIVTLTKGNGLFVNSKRLHYGFSDAKNDCRFIALIINPILFSENSLAVQKYVAEKFAQNTTSYLLLEDEHPALRQISDIYKLMQTDLQNPLHVIAKSLALCAEISDQLTQVSNTVDETPEQISIWQMIDYIHKNFDDKLSIEAIASAGAVCRSKCCRLFSHYIQQTPNAYLNQYRLAKSCEMLRDTSRTISEIAMLCGFQSSSYFTSVFRQAFGLTPKNYRFMREK